MVRGWSYINMMNDVRPSAFNDVRRVAFSVTMNTSMYLKKIYTPATTLVRRKWSRRRHLHNWLATANVMKDWARGYRFYRNYNNFVFNQYFTRNSFIAFSLVSAKNSIPCMHAGSENVLAASVTRRVLKYFSWASNTRLRFLASMKYSAVLLVSYDSLHSKFEDFNTHSALVPLVPDPLGHVVPLEVSNSDDTEQELTLITDTFSLIFQLWLTNLKLIYQTSILLVLTRVKLLNFVFSSKKNDFQCLTSALKLHF